MVNRTPGPIARSDGPVAVASQAEQETSTETNKPVTPGRQHFHPSAAKGWVRSDLSSTPTASYNVSSITDTATGNQTVVWDTDFSSAEYSVNATVHVSALDTVQILTASQVAGSVQIFILDETGTLTETNVDFFSVTAFGDHA